MGGSDRSPRTRVPATLASLVVLLIVLVPSPTARASSPVLPVIDGSHAVNNLSGPVVAPGAGGSVSLIVQDPLTVSIDAVVLTLQVYAFNAYPGNATGSPPAGGLAFGPGPETNVSLGSLLQGADQSVAVAFTTGAAAAQGTYADPDRFGVRNERDRLLFDSRGWYLHPRLGERHHPSRRGRDPQPRPARGLWRGPGTGVLVRSDPFTPWLYGLVVVALILAAAGAYCATRDGPGSRSGARPGGPGEKRAQRLREQAYQGRGLREELSLPRPCCSASP